MKASEIPRSYFDPKWSIQQENKVNLQDAEKPVEPVQQETDEIIATDEPTDPDVKDTEDGDTGVDVTDESN